MRLPSSTSSRSSSMAAAPAQRSHPDLFALPDVTSVFAGYDHRPNGREAVGEHGRGANSYRQTFRRPTSRDAFVALREEHDRSLPMPRSVLHALQVNATPPARSPSLAIGARRVVDPRQLLLLLMRQKTNAAAHTVCSQTNASGLSHHPLCRSSSRRPSRGRSVIRWSGTIVWPGTGSSSKRFIRVARMITASWMAKVPAMQTRGPTPNGR